MALVGAVATLAILVLVVISRVAVLQRQASESTPSPESPLGTLPLTALIIESATYTPTTVAVNESPAPTPTPEAGPATSGTPSTIFIPGITSGGGFSVGSVPATPTSTPMPAATTGPPPPTLTATPTRGPIRITKLGLGVYASGGAMLPLLDQSRPSVILLMDPTVDFAQEVRKRFPKAFIVGRIYEANQALDNPGQRGANFADRVAALAVPLKGTVDAWMSYNEVAASDQPDLLTAYNTFQVAFANRLQGQYGVPAVAANDGPRAIPADLYPKYFAGAIQASKYFGFHLYPNPNVTSLRDPTAADQVFYYRQIKAALDAAGIKSGPFIATEVGLFNGWRGVTDDQSMATDFTWLADQMNGDPYVLGMTVFGIFTGTRWTNFDISGSSIPTILGNYNTVH